MDNKKNNIKRVLAKHILAILICIFFAGLAFFSASGFDFRNLKYSGDSITSDEVPHITSGYYYLESGRYFLNPEHPPLVKDISALPLLILNPSFPKVSMDAPYPSEAEKEDLFFNKKIFPRVLEIENYHWDNRILIFNPKNNPDLIIMMARLSVIIFNAILLFALYFLLQKSWDKRTALIGLFLIAFSQFSLAHGSLVTTDFPASVLQMAALASFAVYARKFIQKKPSLGWFFLSMLIFSLALLSKFSSVIILEVAPLGGLICLLLAGAGRRTTLRYLVNCLGLIVASLLSVIMFYSFHVINSDGAGIVSQIKHNYPQKFPDLGKNIMIKMANGNVIGRAVATYGIGLSMAVNRIDSAGQSAYFAGKVYGSEGAGRWYFPLLYLVKLPLVIHILSLISLLFLLKNKFKQIKSISPLSVLLTAFLVLYSAKAITSNLNIGLRHFMPAIFAISLLTARGVNSYWNEKIADFLKLRQVAWLSFSAIAVSTILSFPHYLSYYNVLGGGTDNGYKIATDSNYDWGQDIKRLGKWMAENNIKELYGDIFSLNAPRYYLGNGFKNFDIKYDPMPSKGSYIAVSAMNYQNNVYDKSLPENKKYSILGKPAATAGKSIFIFQLQKQYEEPNHHPPRL